MCLTCSSDIGLGTYGYSECSISAIELGYFVEHAKVPRLTIPVCRKVLNISKSTNPDVIKKIADILLLEVTRSEGNFLYNC